MLKIRIDFRLWKDYIILYKQKEGECVFTAPIGKRIGAFVIAGAMAGNLCGCGLVLNKNENSQIVFEETASNIESIDSDSEGELIATPVVSDESNIVVEQDNTIQKVCELYDLLFINGCNLQDVNRELSNVLLVRLAGIKVNAEERLVLFNTLGKTVPLDVDVAEFYYPLAKYVHLKNCHEIIHGDENGNIVCDDLNNKAQVFTMMDFEEYISKKVAESGSINLNDAYGRIKAYGYSLDEVLIELDAIYNVCSIPTDFGEDTWNLLFGRLLNTTNEFENVCYVYYDLAVLVHEAVCREEHYVNMFGATECESMTFKLEQEDL